MALALAVSFPEAAVVEELCLFWESVPSVGSEIKIKISATQWTGKPLPLLAMFCGYKV